MNWLRMLPLTAVPWIFLGVTVSTVDALAEQKTLRDQIIGTWTMVAFYTECENGRRIDLIGPNPQGMRIYDRNGYMSNLVMRSDLPKLASNDPLQGTSEENKAIVAGTFRSFFGRYSVNEADQVVTYHIARSVFPNANETDQKRKVIVMADEMINMSTGGSSSSSGSCQGRMIWKRAN